MTISFLLQEARTLEAETLLAHVLKRSREYLWAHPEARVTLPQTRRWKMLLRRLQRGEPLAYLLGSAPFAGRSFFVNKHVLIPRPETELLVEHAITFLKNKRTHTIADVGTGSGCIIVTLAALLPPHKFRAIDISRDALAVAKKNAAHHGVSKRIVFHHGNLLEPLKLFRGPHLILANLPYLPAHDMKQKRNEPRLALAGGKDGLDVYQKLFAQLQTLGAPWTLIAEIDPRQEKILKTLLPKLFPRRRITINKDWNHHARVLTIA